MVENLQMKIQRTEIHQMILWLAEILLLMIPRTLTMDLILK